MKKLITTIILSGVFFAALAQQTFKPVHFYSVTTKINDFSSDRTLKGTIKISMTDSVITISDENVKKYKINSYIAEQTATTDQHITVMWFAFLCTANDNTSCTIQVVRQTQPGKENMMQVSVTSDENHLLNYYCDYSKQL